GSLPLALAICVSSPGSSFARLFWTGRGFAFRLLLLPSYYVDRGGDIGQPLVGLFFFIEGFLQQGGCFIQFQEVRPGAQTPIRSNFVMLDFLGGGDQGCVFYSLLGLFHHFFGFGNQTLHGVALFSSRWLAEPLKA